MKMGEKVKSLWEEGGQAANEVIFSEEEFTQKKKDRRKENMINIDSLYNS